MVIEGFPTVDLAIEYARCIVHSSIEHHRKTKQTKEDMQKLGNSNYDFHKTFNIGNLSYF